MAVVNAVLYSLAALFLLFLIRRVVRHDWIAPVVSGIVVGLPIAAWAGYPSATAGLVVIAHALMFLLLARVGLVAMIIAAFAGGVLPTFPFTFPLSTWYSTVGLGGVLAISALAIASMRITTSSHSERSATRHGPRPADEVRA